ncbi:MAG TPA: RNA 2',3'-cyclic phosphodiesterase [Thermoplasmata archaeon]|nr:RNA 2',3'-cyclic phosphodiesterase [Thermoplasmata archaeon]
MIRTFIAVEIPRFVELENLVDRLRKSGAKISVPRSEGLHVTLKFLGDVEEDSVTEIIGHLESSVSGFAPFDVNVAGTGTFPNPRNPRIFWVGLEDGGFLGRIAKSINESLSTMGFAKESRPFTPHITIARVKASSGVERATGILKESEGTQFGTYLVKDIRLKKSTLTPTGAVYEDLKVISLVKDAASDK